MYTNPQKASSSDKNNNRIATILFKPYKYKESVNGYADRVVWRQKNYPMEIGKNQHQHITTKEPILFIYYLMRCHCRDHLEP
jgi:hypothetical protein